MLLNKLIPTIKDCYYEKRNVLRSDPNYNKFDNLPLDLQEKVFYNNQVDKLLYDYALNSIFLPKINKLLNVDYSELSGDLQLSNSITINHLLKKYPLLLYKQLFEKIIIPLHY